MARKGGSMLKVPTACRFSVLEVSDDSDNGEFITVSGKKSARTSTAKNDSSSSSSTSKKKKQKKRRPKSKTSQADVLEDIELPNPERNDGKAGQDDWQSWQNRDEQTALEASKITNYSKIQQEVDASSSRKKKKEKTLSLDEFISGNTESDIHKPHSNGTTPGFFQESFYGLDEFQEDNIISPSVNDEKPHKKKKKGHEKRPVDEEASKKGTAHIVIPATQEESIKAEMVHIQEQLDKREEIVEKQQKTIEKQKGWISELQKELAQVKKRNKQLCYMLGQGEMKEKADLLLQIEELNEVRDQVVQLHAELEQERSKTSALKHELSKNQTSHGRQRHGSTS